jgi:AhpD family alkylhydroperoxidase
VFRIRGRAILLWQLALANFVVGAWAGFAPHSWFEHFPLFGRHWLISMGQPYDQHLVTDVGWALMALGFLAAWCAAPRRLDPLRGAGVTLVIFGLPHFVYHAFHTDGLSTGDNIANLAILFAGWAIPAALLAASLRQTGGTPVAHSEGEEPRIPPREPQGLALLQRAVRALARRRYGQAIVPIDVTAHSAPIYSGYLTFEWLLEKASSMDAHLKDLGAVKAASLSGCPFCMDIGSAIASKAGVTEQQLRELHMHAQSDAFDETEKLVLDYAEAMSLTPVVVPEEMVERLRERFDEQQVVELTAAIAFENYRGRYNHALGIGSQNFTAGGACALPAAGQVAATGAR